MATPIKKWTLMPGAEIIEAGELAQAQRAQFGVPPCVKLWFQKKLPPPTTFVLPDEFFRLGVVQVCLEFFTYHFLFVLGKAFGKLPPEARLVVIGTEDQLKRARRILEVTLFGFSPEEMRSWRSSPRFNLSDKTIDLLRKMRAWFAPKRPGFRELSAYLAGHGGQDAPMVEAFLAQHGDAPPEDRKLLAYEHGMVTLDDVIEWRTYDAAGRAPLFGPEISVVRKGGNQFEIEGGEKPVSVNLNFKEDQAPYLLALPPASSPVIPDVFRVVCMGADSGFELEHPTTGFALSINGNWAVVDAPVCASYLLAQYGIDSSDVRVVLETHGHEDHMGSAIHFLLECLTAGRSYTYVAAEPVYRTCVAKVAAILGIPEEDADAMLTRGHRQEAARPEAPSGGVLRVTPGVPLRLMGATWHFTWMVHPIPTVGFRIELEHSGHTYAIAYSADTAPAAGFMGVDAMMAEGFLDPAQRPFGLLVRGDEDLVFWEAGGSYGDPIHFDAREWESICAAHQVRPPVVFMHTHPLPANLRKYGLARPGMVWDITTRREILPLAHVVKLSECLRLFRLDDPGYWLRLLICQGELRVYPPGATVVAEGEPADAWFIILQGKAETVVGTQIACALGSGAFFGELALLGDGKRKATVRAQSPMVLLRVPPNVFRDFVVANDLWSFFPKFWADVDLLRQTRLFWGFPHELVALLAKRSERRRYPKGAVLIQQGTSGHELFVITEGAVCITKEHPDGSVELLPGPQGPGEVIGEYGVLVPGARRAATAVAETDIEVLVLTGEVLEKVLAGQIPLQLRLVSMLTERGMPVPRLGGPRDTAK
jgi:CRP-like cAMP-binding protein/glyoxylase-like metal-dependent hydrolase (beta-lactamase superfamily II)